MAFANAFLGVCHSMAHKLGAAFELPHGIANALLIEEVIKYNACDKPDKMGTFPQYDYPRASARYAAVADALGLVASVSKGSKTPSDAAKVEALVKAIAELKTKLEIKPNIKGYGVDEKKFMAALDKISEDAFDDQCTGANPRYPLIDEIKQIYLDAYHGS
jgi:acetaldehyde dehydrogenase/alcohol dehydrogenase